MARTIAPLPQKSIGEALAYLKRALRRNNSGSVFIKPSQAAAELTRFEALLQSVPEKNAPHFFRNWVTEHLSDDGRTRMLNALRRKKADSKAGRVKRRAITVPERTLKELELLAGKTGLPLTKLLAALAAIGNVDEPLQKRLVKLAVAMNLPDKV
ncbi:MAG TPA: hypothetical protein PLT54_06785 [Rhodoferax sp.]|jgi:macrodomain Ter protein organizer (MatP/YcbG family)|nr:hypothetical protein [Rhodoferax sp.]